MKKHQIIIIGAGATGLMAAYKLAEAGEKVLVLEARNRTGGRIHTIYNAYGKIELGAEFVHGDLPVTLSLLNEAGVKYSPAGGEMWRYKDGRLTQETKQVEGWDELIDKMKKLKRDTTLNDFLDKAFADHKYEELRDEVRRYVSGYDTADPDKVSVFALRKEWLNEDEDAQHRLNDGYCAMINYLVHQIGSAGGQVLLNQTVKTINWSTDNAEIICTNGEHYNAGKVIIALPLGVLHQDNLTFSPPVSAHTQALKQIGFGAIIKVLLRFRHPFWEEVSGQDFADAGFILSQEKVPTWWPQSPKRENLLTGWLGGNPARQLKDSTDEEILEYSLESLARIFSREKNELCKLLNEWHIANWTADPLTQGSYAYDTVGSPYARKILSKPVNETLYFAGEYLYEGTAMGTVEAALTSGIQVAATLQRK